MRIVLTFDTADEVLESVQTLRALADSMRQTERILADFNGGGNQFAPDELPTTLAPEAPAPRKRRARRKKPDDTVPAPEPTPAPAAPVPTPPVAAEPQPEPAPEAEDGDGTPDTSDVALKKAALTFASKKGTPALAKILTAFGDMNEQGRPAGVKRVSQIPAGQQRLDFLAHLVKELKA